ncbi:DUF615 domain-containing protein [Sansalvadorimonas sp. 2012CJ34-2]|uniref:Dual-action ribosomal maturation protein DarP n=1 Tax=Parendozoicomonas callyspongiae TaxID=2942213 RepID=A0ABT0PBZ5_9GAMM|nr:ribosome biogenesis factor YjgA [Sansalvadorimonas sp. 2012CJ34-2]MCL6268902.1 DUF615 domain-containing protein [Sansalvadorimonas sp. 2012CJ34-2]
MRKNRNHEELDQDEEIILVSKSELKRDAHELKDLGARLTELKPDQLAKIPLEGRIIDAITETARIKSHNARKRQFGFIGKLMLDQDIDAIRHELAMMDTSSEEYSRHFHILERWRERLINDGNTALTAFLDEHPHADAQQLRQLIRNINKEKSEEKKATLSKKLFRCLREVSES